ncbi:hypothetical protein Ahy_A01g002393 [Arachis hypogaea]|uniref:Uncharacterized protein n=1 Tax=Arachis hypogaea TaxID=3818 RepID=A0A445EQM8_ARAHY|nr:hypothetical protein Ahy_A01g002393 [Arachis hypogaea]
MLFTGCPVLEKLVLESTYSIACGGLRERRCAGYGGSGDGNKEREEEMCSNGDDDGGLKGYACFGCIYRKVCMTGEIKVEETVVECECKEDPICDELNGVEGLRVEDILQMEFSNPKEVRCFYNNYSRLKGFVMGQGKKIPNNVGEIVRQGFRDKKWLEKADQKREHKVVIHYGCLAKMKIKQKNEWQVIPEVGGFNLVRFTKQDIYNEVRKQRGLQNEDVNAVIHYL